MSRQTEFAQRVYRAGIDAGLPDHLARLAATQASLETGYGKSVKGNNFFGIKAGKSWTGDTNTFTTHENYGGKRVKIKDRFRAYKNPSDSLKDWAITLERKFPNAYNSKSFEEAVAGLKTGVYGSYATDPKYSSKLSYINKNFVGNPGATSSVGIGRLPPQRPNGAAHAIDAMAPVNGGGYRMAYSPSSPPRIPTRPSRKSSFGLSDKIKLLNAPGAFGALGRGAMTIANGAGGFGMKLLNGGANLFSNNGAPIPPNRKLAFNQANFGGQPVANVVSRPTPQPSALEQFNAFKEQYRANERTDLSEAEQVDQRMARSAASVRKAIELGLYKPRRPKRDIFRFKPFGGK
jgi:hypothetical protein